MCQLSDKLNFWSNTCILLFRDTENTNKRCPSSTYLPAHPDGLLSYIIAESDGQVGGISW